MADKVTELLVEGLQKALGEPGEQRLFRSVKLPGLFASRSGPSGEAAARAIRDGLLEVVRTEDKGKAPVDWVRPTPKGVEFVHEHESARQPLEELREALAASREAIPGWLAEMQQTLHALSTTLSTEAQRWTFRLDMLSRRVDEAILRADAGRRGTPGAVAGTIPWAKDALVYLDRRHQEAGEENCPLPELFQAVRLHHAELSMAGFHDGLRRLRDRNALRLLPFPGAAAELPQPEYALLEGPEVLYYAAR